MTNFKMSNFCGIFSILDTTYQISPVTYWTNSYMIFEGGKSCTLLTFPCIKVHFYLRLIDCIRSLTIQKEQAFTEFSFVSISNNFSEFIYISTYSPLLDYFSFSSSKFAFLQPEWVLTWGVFLTNFTRGSEFSQVTSWRILPFRFLWGRKGKYRK